jgi:glycosyltransferase involved in cell wall biosynthesis
MAAITVVVCTAGVRPFTLARCLASLQEQSDGVDEVLVVDNSRRSLLDPAEIAAYGARLLREPRGGLDVARTTGARVASGDVVAYIDDDCEADSKWVSRLRKAFDEDDVACVTGRVVPADFSLVTARWFEQRFSFDRGTVPDRFHHNDDRPWYPVYPSHLGTGCNLAVRRSIVLQLGGFDPALDMGSLVGGGGDLDFFARLLDAGHVSAYRPDCLVKHHHRPRRRGLARQFFGYGATVSALCLKFALTRPGHRKEALRFLRAYLGQEFRRMAARARGADTLPLYLLGIELCGHIWGPFGYLLGRLRWRRYRSDGDCIG